MPKEIQQLDRVIIRFAGDSGDGMQLTGDRFTQETASFGNDLSTLPNFPAEIRAPAGTLPGVSSFQLHFADHDIMTPGDAPDVLVAMNPAALKANLEDLPKGATIIVNTDEFTKRALAKVGMIQEGPSRGDGRERVWQVSHRHYSISAERQAGPDEVAAETVLVETFLARQNEKVRRAIARVREDNDEWFDVTTITEQTLQLTADELKELLLKIEELVEPLTRLKRDDPPAGSRSVTMQVRAVPLG